MTSSDRRFLLILVLFLLAYLGGQALMMFTAPKQDGHAYALSEAVTQQVLASRGRWPPRPQDLSSYECLYVECQGDGKGKQVPFSSAFDYAKSKLITAGSGENSCPGWNFSRLRQASCIDLTILAHNFTLAELEDALTLIRAPCRQAPHAEQLRLFQCRDGRPATNHKATLFLWRKPLSDSYSVPERLEVEVR